MRTTCSARAGWLSVLKTPFPAVSHMERSLRFEDVTSSSFEARKSPEKTRSASLGDGYATRQRP